MAGRFITLEGGEGTGKSTQAKLLAEYLGSRGIVVTATREPGGTPFADDVRSLLLSGANRGGGLAEALLFNAARADNLERVIRPALAEGRWVISDRFADSTRAYQGAADGLAPDVLRQLEAIVIGSTRPDLTFILDIEPREGLARALARRTAATKGSVGPADHFEMKELAFHNRLRGAYLAIARAEPERCAVIDAAGSVEEVAQRIRQVIDARLRPGEQAGVR
jgi:dTMP kinase